MNEVEKIVERITAFKLTDLVEEVIVMVDPKLTPQKEIEESKWDNVIPGYEITSKCSGIYVAKGNLSLPNLFRVKKVPIELQTSGYNLRLNLYNDNGELYRFHTWNRGLSVAGSQLDAFVVDMEGEEVLIQEGINDEQGLKEKPAVRNLSRAIEERIKKSILYARETEEWQAIIKSYYPEASQKYLEHIKEHWQDNPGVVPGTQIYSFPVNMTKTLI